MMSGERIRVRSHRKIYKKVNTAMCLLQQKTERLRIAVQSIENKQNEMIQKQKIDALQQELQICIQKMSMQLKRQKILKELVCCLNIGSNSKQRLKQRHSQVSQGTIEKQSIIQKSQIDKILKKYNEQIQKINKLKQQVSEKRSQRVMYSNLYKKLQKQIKSHEQIYKKVLINGKARSDLIKQKCFSSLTRRSYLKTFKKIPRQSQHKKIKYQEEVSQYNYQKSIQDSSLTSIQSIQNNFTDKKSTKDQINKPPSSKFQSYKQNKFNQKSQRYQKTKQKLKSIQYYSSVVQKMKIHSQLQDTKAIIEHYSNLEQKNIKIYEQINDINLQIQELGEKTKKLRKQQQNQRLEEEANEQIDYKQLIDSHLFQAFQQNAQYYIMFETIESISSLFGIDMNQRQLDSTFQQCVKFLDYKIDQLLPERQIQQQSSYAIKNYDQPIINILLQKAEKYYVSQRILSKSLLRLEYHKQKTRFTKSRKFIP